MKVRMHGGKEHVTVRNVMWIVTNRGIRHDTETVFWCGSLTGRALDCHSSRCEFNSRPYRFLNRIYFFSKRALETLGKFKDEIDKCELLCANCHVDTYCLLEKFKQYEDKIMIRVKKYKEPNPKCDRKEVYRLYKHGKTQTEIANELGYSKSTICNIFKKFKIIV